MLQSPNGFNEGTKGSCGKPQRKKLSMMKELPLGITRLYAYTIGAVLKNLIMSSKLMSSQNESAVAVTLVPNRLFWSTPSALQVRPSLAVWNKLSNAGNVVIVEK